MKSNHRQREYIKESENRKMVHLMILNMASVRGMKRTGERGM